MTLLLFFETYYFEEFESLLDELLFRLNALSNSLHHMLPPKAHHYREDSPIISPVPPNMDTQVKIPHVNYPKKMWKTNSFCFSTTRRGIKNVSFTTWTVILLQEFVRTQMTEERFGEITPASHLPQ